MGEQTHVSLPGQSIGVLGTSRGRRTEEVSVQEENLPLHRNETSRKQTKEVTVQEENLPLPQNETSRTHSQPSPRHYPSVSETQSKKDNSIEDHDPWSYPSPENFAIFSSSSGSDNSLQDRLLAVDPRLQPLSERKKDSDLRNQLKTTDLRFQK